MLFCGLDSSPVCAVIPQSRAGWGPDKTSIKWHSLKTNSAMGRQGSRGCCCPGFLYNQLEEGRGGWAGRWGGGCKGGGGENVQ